MNSKVVYLFRHGKSDWNADYQTDHQRPLNSRGINASSLMGRYLLDNNELPDKIYCSSAMRARQTIEYAVKQGWQVPVVIKGELYLPQLSLAIELLRRTDDKLSRIMLVSHEPFCSQLVSFFNEGEQQKFATASVAKIEWFANQWADISLDQGRLCWLLKPKNIHKKRL